MVQFCASEISCKIAHTCGSSVTLVREPSIVMFRFFNSFSLIKTEASVISGNFPLRAMSKPSCYDVVVNKGIIANFNFIKQTKDFTNIHIHFLSS